MPAASGLIANLNREFEEKRAAERAAAEGLSFFDLLGFRFSPALGRILPPGDGGPARLVPVLLRGKHLVLATDEPRAAGQAGLVAELSRRGFFVEIGLASRSSIDEALDFFAAAVPEHHAVRIESFVDEKNLVDLQAEIATLGALRDKFLRAPSAEDLTILLAGALRLGASDVHLEPTETGATIRFRVDGVLQKIFDLPRENFTQLLEQIKYQGHLKLNVRTVPQDGHFTFGLRGKTLDGEAAEKISAGAGEPGAAGDFEKKSADPAAENPAEKIRAEGARPEPAGVSPDGEAPRRGEAGAPAGAPSEGGNPGGSRVPPSELSTTIDIRVSTLPGEFGEGVVLRILDPRGAFLTIDQIGFGRDEPRVRAAIARTAGLVLVTGPTGSGKTTTLYAILREKSTAANKVITLEDPVEYHLPGIEQVSIDPADPASFSKNLRAVLRHDPDVIMVGEIRDGETAATALSASLTGHLVFSTLHTNDAVSAIFRLFHMGVDAASIAPGLELVVAQRLVRRICKKCATRRPLTPDEIAALREAGVDKLPAETPEPVGCEVCSGAGFHGRAAIFSVLPMTDRIRSAVSENAGPTEIARLAADAGMRSLVADGCEKVSAGLTSVGEVLRVAG